jgi:hypothetical protein
MKRLHVLQALFAGKAVAATIVTFEPGTPAPYTLQTRQDAPGPTVESFGGNPDGFLQLTANINSQHNFVPFDQSDPGTHNFSTFSFQFRIDNLGSGGADGFSFSYLDTSIFGTVGGLTGGFFPVAEDPASLAVLGFGFDTWGNGAPNDAGATDANYSEITLFYDGTIISRIDDTRVLPTPFDLKDGAWHTVNGVVNFRDAKVSMQVDGNPIFTEVTVPDLVPFDSRIMFAGRTGGANERKSIDNVNVEWGAVPEPGTAALLGLGCFLMARRRRDTKTS